MEPGSEEVEVLGARTDFIDRQTLSFELMKTIREIDARIDELKIVLGEGPCPGQPERRQKVVDRVHRLIETRACLVYSFMDLNPSYKDKEPDFESCNPFDNIKINYSDLKRHI